MIRIRLSPDQREDLERVKGQAGRMSQRAQIILLSDQGKRVREIAQIQHCSEETVRVWLHRYQQRGTAGLADRPYGRPRGG